MSGIHPLKRYQYLACGLPGVSVTWQELETLNAPAYLSCDSAQFITYLQQAAQEKAGAAERIAFASHADWGRWLEALLTGLGLE